LGWLTGWLYRKSHVLNAASGAGTGYQVKIVVHYGAGADSGEDVYLNGKCRSDFGDVRLTDDDETTLLAYCIEEKVDGDHATVWVKVNDDLGSNRTIYVYYGKADATSVEDGDATFLRWDDFNDGVVSTDRWDILGTGTITESGGVVDILTNVSWGWKRLQDKTARDKDAKCIEQRFKVVSQGDESCGISIVVFATGAVGQVIDVCPIRSLGDLKLNVGVRQYASTLWFDQQLGSNEVAMYDAVQHRVGQRITISGKYVRQVRQKLKKAGSPTGTIYCRIRKVSDDSILAESPTYLDASSLTGSFVWYSFDFPDVYVNEEVRVLIEYSGGGPFGTDVRHCSHNVNVASGVLTIMNGSYVDYATYDSTMQIYERTESWVWPEWVGAVQRSLGTWYRMRVYLKELYYRAIIYNDDWTGAESSGWRSIADAGDGNFYFGSPGNGDESEFDYWFMRKYVDPEPSHGAWGSEESRSVTTLDAGEITETSARLRGQTGGAVVERGFDWGTSPGVYPYSWTESDSYPAGTYSYVASPLSTGVTYYYRAKARDAEGWLYGGEKSFTPSLPLIELRLTAVDPPAPDPERTIYSDLVNLPDPLYKGLTVRIFNADDVTLYMRVDGYAAGWTFTSNDFGSLASGANFYRNIDNFGTRAKPAAATEETVTVRLRAYTDAGYTNLKWTFERVIDVIFIKSDDGSWTQDFLDNFDDGTVQGWAVVSEWGGGTFTLTVVSDYFLSAPYSVRMRQIGTDIFARCRLYKSFTTPNRNNVYAICDVRQSGAYMKNLRLGWDTNQLVYLGRPYDTADAHYTPVNKWMRIVFPLPKNATLEVRVVQETGRSSGTVLGDLWFDDFRIISKD